MATKYIVIELQKYADGSVSAPPINTYDSFNEAVSRWHTILATASISNVPVHSAIILTETGQTVRMDSFNHEVNE